MGTGAPTQPEQLDELLWTLIYRIDPLQLNALKKKNKAADECGLVAAVLRCVLHDCASSLFQIMNDILHKEAVPS